MNVTRQHHDIRVGHGILTAPNSKCRSAKMCKRIGNFMLGENCLGVQKCGRKLSPPPALFLGVLNCSLCREQSPRLPPAPSCRTRPRPAPRSFGSARVKPLEVHGHRDLSDYDARGAGAGQPAFRGAFPKTQDKAMRTVQSKPLLQLIQSFFQHLQEVRGASPHTNPSLSRHLSVIL